MERLAALLALLLCHGESFTRGRSRGPGPLSPPTQLPTAVDPILPAYLWPYPKNATLGSPLSVDASFSLSSVGTSSPMLTSALARYGAMLFPYGPPRTSGGAMVGASVNVIGSDATLHLGTDESYELSTDAARGSVAITAATCFGALRALETLSQLIQYNQSSGTYFMPLSDVSDAPRFPFRGVMVDTARHFLSLPSLRAVIDLMSYDKLNVLHIHLADDQSWPLVIEELPLLASRGAFSNYSHTYTAQDMKDLVAYAYNRGVRVIPEFDTPSHFGILEKSYPEYMASHAPGSYCEVDPSNPGLIPFLTTIWTALADIFPDNTFHIGGDEFWPTCWTENAKIMAWAKALNLPDVESIYNYYIKQVSGILAKLGKKTMGWHEIHGFNGTGPFQSDQVTLDVWSGFYSGSWQEDVAQAVNSTVNASVVVSGPYYVTGTERSVNYHYHNTWEVMYAQDLWNFTTSGDGSALLRVLGGKVCLWGDAAQVDSGDVFITAAPYMHGAAEPWWSPQHRTSGVPPDGARLRLHYHRCRLTARGFPGHPIYFFGPPPCPLPYQVTWLPAWENATVAALER